MPEFVEWMLGFPAGWTDGVSRTQRLKMLGNSVQVQCGELAGLAVVQTLARLNHPAASAAAKLAGYNPGASA